MEMEVPSIVVTLLEEFRKSPTSHVPKIKDDYVNRHLEEIKKKEKIENQNNKNPLIE